MSELAIVSMMCNPFLQMETFNIIFILLAPFAAISAQPDNKCLLLINIDFHTNCASDSLLSSGTVNCSNLQLALALITSASPTPNQTLPICLYLPAGNYSVLYTTETVRLGVHIVGDSANNTLVYCSPDSTFDDRTYDKFPFKFGNGVNVVIEGVGFTNCQRPIFFNGSSSVTLKDCNFRYE